MPITLPAIPVMPENPGAHATPEEIQEYHRQMMQYQNDRSLYFRTIQTIQQQMTEEQTLRSNLDKAHHDAMMAIVNNLR